MNSTVKIATKNEHSFIRQPQVLTEYAPFSASTLWRKIKDGTFPSPVKLSPAVTAWKVKDLVEWQANPMGYKSKGPI